MTRPLMQHGIGQLETMFATMTGDTKVLRQLELELSYRQVPRAYALAEKVAMALRTGAPAAPPARTPEPPLLDDDLFGVPTEPSVPVFLRAELPQPAPESVPSPLRQPLPRAILPDAPQFALSLEESYRLLNVTPAASWDHVEQSRRQLVDRAHPLKTAKLSQDARTQSLADARRVNAAYAAVSTARCSS